MDPLSYILLLIVSFSGVIFGIIISRIAIEEINSITKYANIITPLFIPLSLLVLIIDKNVVYAISFSLILLIFTYFFKNQYRSEIAYSCSGAIFCVSTLKPIGKSLEISVIIFIYGMLLSTIDSSKYYEKKNLDKIKKSDNINVLKLSLRKYYYYIIIGLIFYIITSYIGL